MRVPNPDEPSPVKSDGVEIYITASEAGTTRDLKTQPRNKKAGDVDILSTVLKKTSHAAGV